MTSQNDFLARLAVLLEEAGIPYMVSGSLGSSLHGQPRATNDADIVIDPNREQLQKFVASLGEACYVSRDAVMQAMETRSMFNVIDTEAGWKADIILRKQRPFSRQEFSRRRQANLMGLTLWVVSPEDSILSKLEWSKGRRSEIQYNDALSVLRVQRQTLDFDYLKTWARELNVQDELERLLAAIEK